MEQVYLDDFKLHDLDDDTCPFFLSTPIEGLEFPALRVSTHPKAGEDGTSVSNIFLGERRIMLTGKVHDNGDSEALVALRREFLAACAPIRVDGVLQTRTLRFKALDGSEYRLLVQVIASKMPNDQVSHSTFVIDILAVGGYIESYDEQTETIVTLTRGGFVLPAVLPIVFGSSTGGNATIVNNGDATAYPVITLNGPLTNPRILNETTGEFLALTLTVADGEEIVIDTLEHTVVQGGVTNRLSTLSEASIFWGLQPGDNTVTLTTSVNGETGTATISWRHAYYGV